VIYVKCKPLRAGTVERERKEMEREVQERRMFRERNGHGTAEGNSIFGKVGICGCLGEGNYSIDAIKQMYGANV